MLVGLLFFWRHTKCIFMLSCALGYPRPLPQNSLYVNTNRGLISLYDYDTEICTTVNPLLFFFNKQFV